ncbi:hypothetical protein CEUSTIGMA_g13576.t1 [Chlamydomonas eustigma]|uniref:Uncharacterized protein n=1 Tax=Chlamydomonas eustigma TaxID=1157962 RepID=A0A250XT25_9CHLO|nr:hypothetical protein CEUSTIGMA_g13576.t1 [Chlamydomonas eustigma]|eukprot:GAX86163.1 hypothetical protein CEUSTIGMA_g13576.t1 [Chlamydomonas eustigma]
MTVPCGIHQRLSFFDIIDLLHTGWRIKNQLLQPTRRLDIGGLLISPTFFHQHKEELGLSDADLDPSNKQDMRGMEKVFDFQREVKASKINKSQTETRGANPPKRRPYVMVETNIICKALLDSSAENYGLYLFIEFGHRHLEERH